MAWLLLQGEDSARAAFPLGLIGRFRAPATATTRIRHTRAHELPGDYNGRDTLASSCPRRQSSLVTSLQSDLGRSPRVAAVLWAASLFYSPPRGTRGYRLEEFTCKTWTRRVSYTQVFLYHVLWLGVTCQQASLLAFAAIT